MGRSPFVRDQQARVRAQEAACNNDSQDDKPNVLSSVTNEGSTSHSFQQQRDSASLLVASNDGQLLATRESASSELRKGTFYGQSLLPSPSTPESLDQSPGKRLLETLRPLAETSTEVDYFPSQLSLVSCGLGSALAVIRHLDGWLIIYVRRQSAQYKH
jgi:hypothetical protein